MLRYISIFVFFLCCLAGCQSSCLSEKQIVRLSLEAEPTTLDPRKARDLTSCTLVHMLFEGLTRTSAGGNVELALAKSVDLSPDGLCYTFHLRPSHWKNGDSLNAEDFARSWKNILDPKFPSDIAHHLFIIKNGREVKRGDLAADSLGIQTPDSKTLIVELEAPTPYFLELVSMTPFFPTHPKDPTLTNGPFTLKSWKRSDSLTFAKNNTYWEASSVKLEGIECIHTSSDTGIRMFKEGKLDWAGSPLSTISSDAIVTLKNQGILGVQPFLGTAFLRVNVSSLKNEKNNLLSYPDIRKALAFAIDRGGISHHLLQGGQMPALSLVPKEMGLNLDGYFEDGNSSNALKTLEQALVGLSLKSDDLEPIVLSFVPNERNTALAQIIQKQWEDALGIRVELEAVEGKVYYQRISKKDYQLALGSWTADFNDPINFLEVFKYKDNGTNNTGWEDQRFIDLLKHSSICKEADERKKCLHAAEKILIDQMPIIPIYHYALNYLVQKDLKGVVLSPIGGLDFRWAYWER